MGEKEAKEILKQQGMTEGEAQDFIEGIKRGVEDYRRGRVRRWSEIKKELNIEDPKMEKIVKCPICGADPPPLELKLLNAQAYIDSTPDLRVYAFICLTCGGTIQEFTVDNTIKAAMAFRDEITQLYGESEILLPYARGLGAPGAKEVNHGNTA